MVQISLGNYVWNFILPRRGPYCSEQKIFVFVRSFHFQSCTSNPQQAFLFSAVSTKRASDHVLVDKMAAVPSDVYGHIYSFLVQQKFLKAAKAFKKEALVVSTLFRTFC